MLMRALEFVAGAFALGWGKDDANPVVGDCICCSKSCRLDDAHPSIWYGDYEIEGPICIGCADTVGHVCCGQFLMIRSHCHSGFHKDTRRAEKFALLPLILWANRGILSAKSNQ